MKFFLKPVESGKVVVTLDGNSKGVPPGGIIVWEVTVLLDFVW